jgi:hypothetical protein
MRRRWPLPLVAMFAAHCGGPTVTDSYMALDATGDRRRSEFYTDTESIYCLAEVVAAPKGTTVNATIRMTQSASATPVDVLLAVGEEVVDDSRQTVSFELTKPAAQPNGPWPVGAFECDVFLEGKQAAAAPFRVAMPFCPAYPVSDGETCAGFYPVGARCRAADQTKICTCDASGSWKC